MYRCRLCLLGCHQCMTDLMIRYDQLLLIGKNSVFLLVSCNDYFNTFFKICLCGKFTSVTYCTKSRFIHNVGKFCTGSTGGSLGNLIKSDCIRNLDLLCMYFQDFFSSLKIRKLYRDSSVKTSRTEKCRVKGIRTVGSCKDYNTLGTVKSIHLCKKLIQSLLSFVVAASETCSISLLTDSIDLINEYNTRCFLVSLFEKVTNLGRTHTNKHLHKLRTGNREEWYLCLTCYCLGKKSLTSSGRSYKKSTFRHRCTDLCVFMRIVKIIHDLCKKLLGFIFPCHICKLDSCRGFYIDFRITFAKGHGSARSSTHR